MIKFFNKYLLIALFSSLFLTDLNSGLAAVNKALPVPPTAERKPCQFKVNERFLYLFSSNADGVSIQECQLVLNSEYGEVIRVEHTGEYSEQDKEIIEASYWNQIEAEIANHARHDHYYTKPIKVFTEIEITVLSQDGKELAQPLPAKILYQVRTSTVTKIMKEFEILVENKGSKFCQFKVNERFLYLFSSALNKVSVQECQLVINSNTGEVIRVEHTGEYSEQDKETIEASYWNQIEAKIANHARYDHYYTQPITLFTEIEITILSQDGTRQLMPAKILYRVRPSTVAKIMRDFGILVENDNASAEPLE